MKTKFYLPAVILYVSIAFFTNSCKHNNSKKNNNETFINNLINKMTLEEKVGQMTQLNISIFYKDGKLQKDKLKKYITEYNIGSILNVPQKAISMEDWNKLLTIIAEYSNQSRLKIPVLYGIDAIHGVSYSSNSTLFPHNIGIAATRNPKLAYKTAEITAKEVRACGIRWNFDPVLGVGRQPLWPRFEETFGEDPLLVTTFGNQMIKAYEGDDLKQNNKVASCMKHFIGYTIPANGNDRTPAYIPDIMLYDIFIPPFKKAVENGSSTIMINSGSINGIPVHINKYLITDLLKNKWGFKGLVVTDWTDIIFLYTQHKVARNNKEAVQFAVNAGIDMSMVPFDLSFYDDLIELVKEGKVKMDRINDAVLRILRVKQKLGLFDNPFPEKEAMKNFNLPEYKNVALQSALESITLLKNSKINNKPILPLSKNIKVLIAGPAAKSLASLHGSWSYTWLGDDDSLFPKTTLNITQAIENKIGENNVICTSPDSFSEITDKQIKELKNKAKNVDCIILCLGENSYAESFGNIKDLTLPKNQIKLAKAAVDTKKPVILVLTEGRPRIINEIADDISSILLAYRPGSKGANAITDVLFGDYCPNGKLPFTYPKHTGNLITYDAPIRNQKLHTPQWPFGHGLSYTTFKFGNINISTDTLVGNQNLLIDIDVTNTGKRNSLIAIDLFIKDLVASIIPPMKKLRKFKKISLNSGETKNIKFSINKNDLGFVNSDLKYVTEPGSFEISINDKSKIFYYKK